MPRSNLIYHVTTSIQWDKMKDLLYYTPVNLGEVGFIHACYLAQIDDVLKRHFQGKPNLILLEIEVDKIEAPWKEEESYPGEWYPHIYGALNTNAVKSTKIL